MANTAHFGKFDEGEVLLIEEFANRLQINVRTAERVLEKMQVPIQTPARGVNLVSMYQFRLAVEKGGFNRWNRRDNETDV